MGLRAGSGMRTMIPDCEDGLTACGLRRLAGGRRRRGMKPTRHSPLNARLRLLGLCAFLFVTTVSPADSSLTAEEIIRNVDEHRLVGSDCEMGIRVQCFRKNLLENEIIIKATITAGAMTSLLFLEPPNMKGRTLVIEDREMWLVIPGVKNPIRITPSQKLVGGISFGDIVGVSFADGYAARLKGEEPAEGMRPDGSTIEVGNCYVLTLVSRGGGTNYHEIIVWVEKRELMPVKAELFALSGKKMMAVYFTAPKMYNGKKLITKTYMFDQINPTKYFSMEYFDIKPLH
ncbi:MAG: outer membrane lipoprotein-sorting protein [Patescibacteria group bacterium]